MNYGQTDDGVEFLMHYSGTGGSFGVISRLVSGYYFLHSMLIYLLKLDVIADAACRLSPLAENMPL